MYILSPNKHELSLTNPRDTLNHDNVLQTKEDTQCDKLVLTMLATVDVFEFTRYAIQMLNWNKIHKRGMDKFQHSLNFYWKFSSKC